MKAKMVLLYTGLVSILLGFVGWRLQAPRRAVPLEGILVDRSRSMQSPCNALAGLIERQMGRSPAEFVIFATGDKNNADEPVLLLSLPAPTQARLIKGKRRLVEEQEAFIGRLQALCSQQPATLVSPVYLGIRQAVAHLRAAGGQVERRLFVISDLREDFDAHIERALAQPLGTKTRLPPPIDNGDISIEVCGYAQTRDRQPLQSDRLIEVWQQLFTDPPQVSFKPFCAPVAAPQDGR